MAEPVRLQGGHRRRRWWEATEGIRWLLVLLAFGAAVLVAVVLGFPW